MLKIQHTSLFVPSGSYWLTSMINLNKSMETGVFKNQHMPGRGEENGGVQGIWDSIFT
jgi:hypothetical protein